RRQNSGESLRAIVIVAEILARSVGEMNPWLPGRAQSSKWRRNYSRSSSCPDPAWWGPALNMPRLPVEAEASRDGLTPSLRFALAPRPRPPTIRRSLLPSRFPPPPQSVSPAPHQLFLPRCGPIHLWRITPFRSSAPLYQTRPLHRPRRGRGPRRDESHG